MNIDGHTVKLNQNLFLEKLVYLSKVLAEILSIFVKHKTR